MNPKFSVICFLMTSLEFLKVIDIAVAKSTLQHDSLQLIERM